MIRSSPEELSIAHQCRLLGVNRSGLYYHPVEADPEDLLLQRLVDEQFTRTPFYGNRRMCAYVGTQGIACGRDRMRSVMETLGIEAIYPKRNLSVPHPAHKKYPYLLRGKVISAPNQVWSTDITYIRLQRGAVYLAAVLDWYSRYVLSWRVSTTLDADFCCEALEEALEYGVPLIFNTDQGSQFTSQSFTDILLNRKIQISMDGRGRALDNVFVERLWRSVKYEEVYLKEYVLVRDAREGLGAYFKFYNHERLHQSLDYRTPAVVHHGPQVRQTAV